MTGILLHQYDTSPFSEKVRVCLGIKRLAWRAVDQPVIMPKPDLLALTGAYRRIPVMQIGANVSDRHVPVRRIEDDAGTVVVHLPRIGYATTAAG